MKNNCLTRERLEEKIAIPDVFFEEGEDEEEDEDLDLIEIALDDPLADEMLPDTPFPDVPITPWPDDDDDDD